MAITSRNDLKQYALRALGAPVLEINVDDDQLEDRIEDALYHWHINHYDGVEKVYLKQLVHASKITIVGTNAADFAVGSTLICKNTSNEEVAKVKVAVDQDIPAADNVITVVFLDRDLIDQVADIISITDGTNSATVDTFVVGEIDKRYLDIPDYIYGVSRVLPFSGTNTSRSLFDIQYQLRLHDLYDLTSTSIIYYKMVMSHLALLDLELNGKPMFRFNRLQGRLFVDTNWDANINVGDFLVVECYRALDPEQFNRVWAEPWLRQYVTALFKKQWAVNMKKFQGLQLPGGVTLDGKGLYAEAMQEIADLEAELLNKSGPPEFYMG